LIEWRKRREGACVDMKKMRNRIAGLVLAAVLLLGMAVEAGAVTEASAEGQGTGLTLQDLRRKFPEGKYWNHADRPGLSDAVNNQDGYTSIPCPDHSDIGTTEQTCNGFAPDGLQLSGPGTAADCDSLLAMLARVDGEKRKLVPECYKCAASCGRTDNFDMERLLRV